MIDDVLNLMLSEVTSDLSHDCESTLSRAQDGNHDAQSLCQWENSITRIREHCETRLIIIARCKINARKLYDSMLATMRN